MSLEKYERMLFEIAPWTEEMMQTTKLLNDGSFLRGRTGWNQRGIKNPESIYEHACKVAIAAYHLFGTDEAITQGVIHDHGEVLMKDYVPGQIKLLDKKEKEYIAMKEIKDSLPNGDFWFEAWKSFEEQKGIGYNIFELDKICPNIQVVDYYPKYPNHDLDEFYPYSRKKISSKPLIDLLDDIALNSRT